MNTDVLIEEIAYQIGQYCVRWGRLPVKQTKGKYSTCRVYCRFGIQGIHGLLFPNYVYKHRKFPQWLWELDINYISKFFNLIHFIIIPWQIFIYRKAYWKYIHKYPDLFEEITSCMDYPEIMGFKFPYLCSDCSETSKNCYLTEKDKCERCSNICVNL